MVRHLIQIVAATSVAIACMMYPFLPGNYDASALALSTLVQLLGAAALLLAPVGIIWLIYEAMKQTNKKRNLPHKDKGYSFAIASVMLASILTTLVSLMISFGISIFWGILTFALLFYSVSRLLPRLKSLKQAEVEYFNPAPLYLVFIPIVILLFQIMFAAPLTEFSRNHAIENSNEFIGDIEAYHDEYGHYPVSLTAMWKDYYPDIVGIEKFNYLQFGESYNLSFEQPRFFFDNFGTREWVVYNPRDEHRMFSHTAWFLLLTPDELERSQGWYAVHDTAIPHWKYFWFD